MVNKRLGEGDDSEAMLEMALASQESWVSEVLFRMRQVMGLALRLSLPTPGSQRLHLCRGGKVLDNTCSTLLIWAVSAPFS